MNPEVKTKWVEALRSGEYRQGRGALNDEGAFCCLGVLCDLSVREGVGTWTPEGRFSTPDGDEGFSLPPRAVVEWAGLEDQQPVARGGCIELPALNDAGTTFEEIADLIVGQL